MLKKALDLADWKGYAKRRAASEKNGKLRGVGIATVIEPTGAGMFPKDEIEIEVDAEGRVTVYSVSQSQGQGHETTFAMMVAKALEIPAERIRVRQCVADHPLIGNHTGGSRTMVGAGTVCHIAGEKLVQHGKSLAAEELGLEPSQVSYSRGEFRGPEAAMKMTLGELAPQALSRSKAKARFPRPSPTAATSPKSKSIPTPASPTSLPM